MQAPNAAYPAPSAKGLYWNLGLGTLGLLSGIVLNLGRLVYHFDVGPDISAGLVDGVFEGLFILAYLGVAFAFTGLGAAWSHKLCMIAGVIQFIMLADLYLFGILALSYYLGLIAGGGFLLYKSICLIMLVKVGKPKLLYPIVGGWLILSYIISMIISPSAANWGLAILSDLALLAAVGATLFFVTKKDVPALTEQPATSMDLGAIPQQSIPMPGSLPQPGMSPQSGMPPQGSNPQSGMPQQGMPQQGMPQQGMPQQGMPQQGMPQQGVPQQGVPQQGSNPHGGMPPQGSNPQGGMPPQGGQNS